MVAMLVLIVITTAASTPARGAVVMVNSDSYEIIYEILNGIAGVYDWKRIL